MTTTNPSKGPPIAVPTAFNGDRTLTDKFVYECDLYVQGKPKDFDNGGDPEEQKITFMLSYMNKGLASNWAQRYQKRDKELDTAQNDPKKHKCLTFAAFKKEVSEAFKEHNPGESARARLDLLHQGNSSVDAYTEIFIELGAKSGYDEAALRHLYIKGLRNDIQNQIMLMAEIPSTLSALQDKATEFDLRRSSFNRRQYILPSKGGHQRAQGSGTRDDPININRTFVRRTPEEIQQLRNDRKCFHCGQPGHIARNCPSKDHQKGGYPRPNQWRRAPVKARVVSMQDKIGQLISGASADELNQLALACKDAEVSQEGSGTQDF